MTVKRRKIEHLQMVTPHRAIAIKDGAPQISNGTSSSVSGQNPTLP